MMVLHFLIEHARTTTDLTTRIEAAEGKLRRIIAEITQSYS